MTRTPLLTKSDQIATRIKSELARGQFRRGDKFCSVNQVVRQYKVASATAHRALRSLVDAGVLRVAAGKGFVVENLPHREQMQHEFDQTDNAPAGRAKMLYVMAGDVAHSQTQVALRAIHMVCASRKCHLEVVSSGTADVVKIADDPDVVGILWERAALPSRPVPISKPVITLGHTDTLLSRHIAITSDMESSSRKVMQFLHMLGHRRIAILAYAGEDGRPADIALNMIARQWQDLMEEYGLQWDPGLLKYDFDSEPQAYVDRFLDTYRNEGITAVWVFSWSLILRLTQDMSARGLKVWQDLSIIGNGASDFMQYIRPTITRIEFNMPMLAQKAAELLLGHASGAKWPDTAQLNMPVELVVGESTGPVR